MTRTRLGSTHDLFINGLVVSGSRVVSNFATPTKRIRQVATWYWLSADRKLYWRFFGEPYLSCLHPEEVSKLLAELNDEVCGSHVGGCSLAHQAMTQGFWWPQMQKDVAKYVRKCEQCQKHAPLIQQLAGHLNPVSILWPFTQWGLDILSPFPWATGNRKFVLVGVNYFTKGWRSRL